MSFFMTISGQPPKFSTQADFQLMPAARAQEYLSRLEVELARLDGGPVLFVDDKESGTSDSVVSAYIDALLSGEGNGGSLGDILAACFQGRISFRIWMANNNQLAYLDVIEVKDLAEAQTALKDYRGVSWHAAC